MPCRASSQRDTAKTHKSHEKMTVPTLAAQRLTIWEDRAYLLWLMLVKWGKPSTGKAGLPEIEQQNLIRAVTASIKPGYLQDAPRGHTVYLLVYREPPSRPRVLTDEAASVG